MHVSREGAVPRPRRPRSFHRLLLAILSLACSVIQGEKILSPWEACHLRCVAKCVSKQDPATAKASACDAECEPYEGDRLCAKNDTACWSICKTLGAPSSETLAAPGKVNASMANGVLAMNWQPVPGALVYAVQYKTHRSNAFSDLRSMLTTTPSLSGLSNPTGEFCAPFEIRVAAASVDAVSAFSDEREVDAPRPDVSPRLKLVSLRYSAERFESDFSSDNGTVIVTFEFDGRHWPLGDDDLEISPMFHMISCAEVDLSRSDPMAEFRAVPQHRQLETRLGASVMFRRCRYVYYVQSARSATCDTILDMSSPPADALQTLDISCANVDNNPCPHVDLFPQPICGQILEFTTEVLNQTVNADDTSAELAIAVEFRAVPPRAREPPTLYYVALFGHADSYSSGSEESIAGVNQTDVIGNSTTCMEFARDGACIEESNNTFVLYGVHLDTLYGVTICAVKDTRNLTFPDLSELDNRSAKPHASKLYISSEVYRMSHTGIAIGLSLAAAVAAVAAVIVICVFFQRRQRRMNATLQLKEAQIAQAHQLSRYTDFPKKDDIWEIDRRNVDVHTSKKLGQGAFGAVYQGKLIGKSLGHPDANSPLGINLMRTENCTVAVKMLPESADDASKEEFLREISLMKSLGYHERLVNLLACVTKSEPLLLVVEFCAEGDLLHFLRHRCNYMMKLDEMGISYVEPRPEDNVDLELIVTIKQLLIFAVQISYGLEYLSQKGFVHRDVAARNVLVNTGNECKIGDFGLCRRMDAADANYMSRGGRLPLKWMSPEAIRNYNFSTKSDVWSFGILLFEIITLGGSPYPEWPAEEVLMRLEKGERIGQPDNCPDEIYEMMCACWSGAQQLRPDFSSLRQRLASLLEEVTGEYSYLKLDAQRDYYNVQYDDGGRVEIKDMPTNPSKLTGIENPAFRSRSESATSSV